jgi:hypothetical protein
MPLARSSSDPLHPGTSAPSSGIYKAVHGGHRGDHFVSVVKHDVLPYCRSCHLDVRFHLWSEAPYVEDDPDFTSHRLLLVKP